KALEPAADGDRADRAARVVERALVPAGTNERKALAEAEPAKEETASSRFNLFNLTRSWRGKESEEAPTEAVVAAPPAAKHPTQPEKTPKAKPNGKTSKTGVETPTPTTQSLTPDTHPPLPILVFQLPPLTLLKESPPAATSKRSQAELTDKVQIIEQTLEQ